MSYEPDAMLIASQICCAVVAAISIVVATYTHRRMVCVWEMKEVEARLADVKKLETIDWKPGTILWVQVEGSGRNGGDIVSDHMRRFLSHHLDMDDPPMLVTSDCVTIQAISVVDLLALISKVRDDG